MIEKEAEKILQYKYLTIEMEHMLTVKNKSDISIDMGNWNLFNTIRKLSEKHSRKSPNQGTAESRHVWHCIHTSDSTNKNVRNIQHGE